MLVSELVKLLNAELICSGNDNALEGDLKACASDLMSDVLRLDDPKIILITGLNNLQAVRTAEIADIKTIILVRNKYPAQEMITLAEKENLNLIVSEKSMFHTCGLLFKAGIKPVY